MYSGLTASTYRNTAYDCATVAVKGSSGAIADAAETLLSDAADGLEPVTPASPTVLQIDDQYGGVAHRAGDRIPVTVTCLVASSRHCSGRLALTQQSTHTNLGRLRFTLPLGTSRTIRVPVHLTPALRRLKTLFVVERLSADHGRSTRTVTDVKHAD
jgi:hypothetical protein